MASYAIWNNKTGVGKSILGFFASSAYAYNNPDKDVYVIDMCPQANISETLLGGQGFGSKILERLMGKEPRATVGGYIRERLKSPFRMIDNSDDYITTPSNYNSYIPENLYLLCGDSLTEILSNPINHISNIYLSENVWKKVLVWISDIKYYLSKISGERESVFIIDCNPSFSIHTQLGIVASEGLIVPFMSDESSYRAIVNIFSLVYGLGCEEISCYEDSIFHERARRGHINIPKLHTFINNRTINHKRKYGRRLASVTEKINRTIDNKHKEYGKIFYNNLRLTYNFMEFGNYYKECLIAMEKGIPLNKMESGPQHVREEILYLNQKSLDQSKEELRRVISRF